MTKLYKNKKQMYLEILTNAERKAKDRKYSLFTAKPPITIKVR